MVLTVGSCNAHIEHTLGGDLSPGLSSSRILNDAGEYLCTIHPWKWLETVDAKLDLRGQISATGMDWDTDTKTLSETNQFANYAFLEGDMIEITAGTNVTLGWYRISSSTDDNLVLVDSIGASLTDDSVKGTIHTWSVALPSDFRELIDINTTSGLLKGVQLTSYGDLIQKRAAGFTSAGFHWGAISHAIDETSNSVGGVTPRLEIWPTPSSNETGALSIFYRRGWDDIGTNPSSLHELRIPKYLESFYLQLVRAFTRGYEEEEEGTMSQRLTEVTTGPLFLAAIDRDGSIQPHYGVITGGAVESSPEGTSPFSNFDTIADLPAP